MTDALLERVEARIGRAGFVQRSSVAAVAAVAAALGRPQRAMAVVTTHGCDLCDTPGTCPSLSCTWCWTGRCHSCSYAGGANRKHYCCEGYVQANPCDGSCIGVGWGCSWLSQTFSC